MKHRISDPRHIAIIMDGNRRWAREHHLPVIEGHRRVATKILEPLIEHAADVGIEYLALWAWSTENWKRDSGEVRGIMKLLKWGFGAYGERMHKKGMRVKVIGDISKLNTDIQKQLNDLIELTKNNTRITVIFALNYGGRDEIVRAMNKVISDKFEVISKLNSKKRITPLLSLITEKEFSETLDTSGIPDPDLIIRPGGEKRLSGFLLWQSEYAELYFADWYMPEFTPEKLDDALADYDKRKRRFGK